jgi:hypothetical protein
MPVIITLASLRLGIQVQCHRMMFRHWHRGFESQDSESESRVNPGNVNLSCKLNLMMIQVSRRARAPESS